MIINSSRELLQQVRPLRLPLSSWILHLDIRDFFLKGTPDFHVSSCQRLANAGDKTLVHDVARFILDNQFVASALVKPFFDDQGTTDLGERLYRMIEGTGMGLLHSSAVASASFCSNIELNGPSIATSRVHQQLGILLYRRYADNCFFILDAESRVAPIIEMLRSVPPYELTLEDATNKSTRFLDVDLSLTSCGDFLKLDFAPVVKPLGILLHPASGHLLSTHGAWPLAYIRSLAIRSSCDRTFRCATKQFFDKLRRSGWCDDLISAVNDRCHYSISEFHAVIFDRSTIPQPSADTVRIVVPFHPVWKLRRVVDAALNKLRDSEAHRQLLLDVFNVVPRLTVSWKLSSKPFLQTWVSW